MKNKKKPRKNLKKSKANKSVHIIGRHWNGYSEYSRIEGTIEHFVKKAKELREKRHEGKLPETFTVELVD